MIQIPTSFNEFTPTYAKELCIKAKKGELPTHERRLTKLEKLSVQPNTCYIYLKSKIKRWTDGLDWSPSRISDCFLVYKSDNLIRKNISFKDLNLSVCAYFPNLCRKKEKMIFNLENYKSEKFKNFIVNFHNFKPTNLINTQLMQNKSNTNPLQRDLFYNFKVKKELKLKENFEDINLSLDSKTNSEIENQPNNSIISDSFFGFEMNKNVF